MRWAPVLLLLVLPLLGWGPAIMTGGEQTSGGGGGPVGGPATFDDTFSADTNANWMDDEGVLLTGAAAWTIDDAMGVMCNRDSAGDCTGGSPSNASAYQLDSPPTSINQWVSMVVGTDISFSNGGLTFRAQDPTGGLEVTHKSWTVRYKAGSGWQFRCCDNGTDCTTTATEGTIDSGEDLTTGAWMGVSVTGTDAANTLEVQLYADATPDEVGLDVCDPDTWELAMSSSPAITCWVDTDIYSGGTGCSANCDECLDIGTISSCRPSFSDPTGLYVGPYEGSNDYQYFSRISAGDM